jgi:hypothetical protein
MCAIQHFSERSIDNLRAQRYELYSKIKISMEDWRSNDKKLLQIAQQKIWLHWLMWFVPVISIVTIFVSAVLIREVKPLAIALGVAFVFGFLAGSSGEASLFVLGTLTSSAIGACLTQIEIQKARDEVDARRNA